MKPFKHREEVPGQDMATRAQLFCLANLTVLPVIGFFLLWRLYKANKDSAPKLAKIHMRQAFLFSIVAGILLIAVNALVILLGGFTSPATWVFLILYFTSCHAGLILFTVFGLVKAMGGDEYYYPLLKNR